MKWQLSPWASKAIEGVRKIQILRSHVKGISQEKMSVTSTSYLSFEAKELKISNWQTLHIKAKNFTKGIWKFCQGAEIWKIF